jgi:hypothetical protein
MDQLNFNLKRKGRRTEGRSAIWQARLALLVMINIAQLWILSATIEAALARHFKQLIPLVLASGVCWAIALTIFLWWKPSDPKSRFHRSRRTK